MYAFRDGFGYTEFKPWLNQSAKVTLDIFFCSNFFFALDTKFLLPNKRALLQRLQGATIFLKFDLKFGFWQLDIHPEEKYKTAFCLPNRHLQRNVLPFGLKTAPSLFQQAMLRIFKSLHRTIFIYIDDILLFSSNEKEHPVSSTISKHCHAIWNYALSPKNGYNPAQHRLPWNAN